MNDLFVGETASWDVLCCLGSLLEPVLYLQLLEGINV